AHGRAHPAAVELAAAGRLRVRFDPPVSQVAAGQPVVLYRSDEVLGGGTVAAAAR
ncbi:MAG TPA: aminomethyltransferase beta-barrel domain-containing protein, partial [Candidatus Dormibacteraeota bacterium]